MLCSIASLAIILSSTRRIGRLSLLFVPPTWRRNGDYHAFLAGLFTGAGYAVESNHEYGLGRPDLVVRDRKNRRIIMIEIKYSGSENQMLCDCGSAIQQINIKQYANQFLKGYQVVLCYGIAFFGKQCLVKSIQSN